MGCAGAFCANGAGHGEFICHLAGEAIQKGLLLEFVSISNWFMREKNVKRLVVMKANTTTLVLNKKKDSSTRDYMFFFETLFQMAPGLLVAVSYVTLDDITSNCIVELPSRYVLLVGPFVR